MSWELRQEVQPDPDFGSLSVYLGVGYVGLYLL